jgi:BirA family biotin operon repressor/biotin-[acetyl-CoA-carboxylase] ligase
MIFERLQEAVACLPLGALRYFDSIGSTQTEAARWADAGAPDLALVVADEQTAGRGRQSRRWFTPPGSALAFSLVLRRFYGNLGQVSKPVLPTASQEYPLELPLLLAHLTALGALAVCQALSSRYNLAAQIKWPNDVVIDRRKVAGVLAEAHWQGSQLKAVILGIGVNVRPQAVPPESDMLFPATCVETALGRSLSRWEFLRVVLEGLMDWRERLGNPEFLKAWEGRLAFKGEWVYVGGQGGIEDLSQRQGQVLGLDAQGCLRLRDPAGEEFTLRTGELSLRPVNQPPPPLPVEQASGG